MTLVLPSEIVVDEVLPTVRELLARKLADRGLTQQEIATHLGVTQAAVSAYVNEESAGVDAIADHPRTQETVERIADGFAGGTMDGYEALAELLDLIRTLEDRGPICERHEELMPALQGLSCDLCVRGPDREVAAERAALSNVRQAARTLAGTAGMSTHIPKVGTNVGTALPDAAETTDVAAIPGRIYAMGDRVEVPANPEFGASEYVATLVLAAMEVDPSVRGALNLATDDGLLDAARERGIEPVEFDAGYEDRRERLRERFAELGTVPRVLYHRGAFGIEPILYVLGETGEDAAALAAALVADAR